MMVERLELDWPKCLVWALLSFVSLAAIMGLILAIVEGVQWLLG